MAEPSVNCFHFAVQERDPAERNAKQFRSGKRYGDEGGLRYFAAGPNPFHTRPASKRLPAAPLECARHVAASTAPGALRVTSAHRTLRAGRPKAGQSARPLDGTMNDPALGRLPELARLIPVHPLPPGPPNQKPFLHVKGGRLMPFHLGRTVLGIIMVKLDISSSTIIMPIWHPIILATPRRDLSTVQQNQSSLAQPRAQRRHCSE